MAILWLFAIILLFCTIITGLVELCWAVERAFKRVFPKNKNVRHHPL